MRAAEITRKTLETDIKLKLSLDGSGKSETDTGVGFFDHMLTIFSRHGMFDLEVKCKGDTHVDNHHTVEDIGICLGAAFAKALGEARGISRYGSATVPMDEALAMCVVDVSGRSFLGINPVLPIGIAGGFSTQLLEEFMLAFTRKAGITVHLRLLEGKDTHHIIEACFKALARALRDAVMIDETQTGEIPSTKGLLY